MAYNFAIGDKNEEVTLHISNNASQSSSVLELGTHLQQHPEVHYVGDVTVPMRTLENFIFPFDVDFLNMDIQGYELHALKGLGTRIDQFRWCYLEVNRQELYKGCGQVNDIDYYLGAFGFRRVETLWIDGS